jgi:hypothetical protein
MSNILHDINHPPITLPTRHPTWCQVDSHQGVLDDLLDGNDEALDETEVDRVRKHWAAAGEHNLLELRAGTDDRTEHFTRHVVRDAGGSWNLTLEQQPDIDDVDGAVGLPFISFCTMDLSLVGATCVLTMTSGEARTLAAQLVAAADRLDLV